MTSINNTTGIFALILIFVYLVIYKKYKLLGGICFALAGLGLMAYATTDYERAIGLITLLTSIVVGGIAWILD